MTKGRNKKQNVSIDRTIVDAPSTNNQPRKEVTHVALANLLANNAFSPNPVFPFPPGLSSDKLIPPTLSTTPPSDLVMLDTTDRSPSGFRPLLDDVDVDDLVAAESPSDWRDRLGLPPWYVAEPRLLFKPSESGETTELGKGDGNDCPGMIGSAKSHELSISSDSRSFHFFRSWSCCGPV
jgi:hypothetical protein